MDELFAVPIWENLTLWTPHQLPSTLVSLRGVNAFAWFWLKLEGRFLFPKSKNGSEMLGWRQVTRSVALLAMN